MKLTKDRLKKIIKEEIITERLKRFKVFVSGESEPLILMGKNEKEVKQTAHMMIKNSSIKIRKVVKESLIKEGMYGEKNMEFVPLRVDKYAPNTRLGLKNTIESLEGAPYGFGLSEDSEMDWPNAADAAHAAYNKWAKGMGTKLQSLHKQLSNGWKIYDDAFSKALKKERK